MYLYKENFTSPKEQISLYLTVLKQYVYSFKYSMKPDINSIVNSADPDQPASSEICMFWVTGLNLGRVGTHKLFLIIFFSGKNIILCKMPFKMHKFIFFPRKYEKNSRFHQ